jgi:hypothetical protein
VLPSSTQVCGFKTGRRCQDVTGRKTPQRAFLRRGFKISKRSLNETGKSTFRQNYGPTFSPTVPSFAARISRVLWTWKHLAAEVGTSQNYGGQGSHNKPIGCGASRAYAPDPDDEKEEMRK